MNTQARRDGDRQTCAGDIKITVQAYRCHDKLVPDYPSVTVLTTALRRNTRFGRRLIASAIPNSALPCPHYRDSSATRMRLVRPSGRKKPRLVNIDGRVASFTAGRTKANSPVAFGLYRMTSQVVMNLSRRNTKYHRSADKFSVPDSSALTANVRRGI